jgi:hypothetical protein
MQGSFKTKTRRALEVFITFVPWVISLYTLYWLEYSGVWTTETAHRGKTSVAVLVTGMALSFFVHSYFAKHEKS